MQGDPSDQVRPAPPRRAGQADKAEGACLLPEDRCDCQRSVPRRPKADEKRAPHRCGTSNRCPRA